MSLQALTAYLSIQKPGHTIDSAYALEQKYRLAAQTVISQLQSHGYQHTVRTYPASTPTPTPTPTRKVWVKQETQLDRVERLLVDLIAALAEIQPVRVYSHVQS